MSNLLYIIIKTCFILIYMKSIGSGKTSLLKRRRQKLRRWTFWLQCQHCSNLWQWYIWTYFGFIFLIFTMSIFFVCLVFSFGGGGYNSTPQLSVLWTHRTSSGKELQTSTNSSEQSHTQTLSKLNVRSEQTMWFAFHQLRGRCWGCHRTKLKW